MSVDWVVPIATSLVGIAGIGGTVYGARLQRGTQLESIRQQKSLEATADARLQKQKAFVEFWSAYQALLRALQMNASSPRPKGNQDRAADAFAHLFEARNVVALVASMYIVYFVDQMMSDAEAMTKKSKEMVFAKRFPDAEHKVYYLMRAELSGEDWDAQDAEDVANALRVNSLRLASIHETLSLESLG